MAVTGIAEVVAAMAGGPATGGSMVDRTLVAMRQHLGMDVAYVSEFVGDRAVFRGVDAPGCEALIKVGDSHSLDDVYCRHILAGRLPELIPDTADEPLAMTLPITQAVPIRAHVSVPIWLADGRPYGMFCCIGFRPDPSLRSRDLQMMRAFADLAGFEIARDLATGEASAAQQRRLREVVDHDRLRMVYQPIWDVRTGQAVGFESLARFATEPYRSPDKWFAEAADAGVEVMLEVAAIRAALAGLATLPADMYLTINASPVTIVSPAFRDALRGHPPRRLVVEVTEHAAIDDSTGLAASLAPLRRAGLRLAVDDAGAGYAGLRQILDLQPDLIKLDMSLVRGIDRDTARQALARALVDFARQTDSRIVAEGVETPRELDTLRRLEIPFAQGFLLGRPVTLSEAAAQSARPALKSAA